MTLLEHSDIIINEVTDNETQKFFIISSNLLGRERTFAKKLPHPFRAIFLGDSMKVNCEQCGEEKEVFSSRYKRNKYNFCSHECYSKFLTGKKSSKPSKLIKTNCDQCGKEIDIYPCKQKRNKYNFCSRECSCKYMVGVKKPRMSNLIKINCEICGKERAVYPSRIKNNNHNFCSQKCSQKYQIGKERSKEIRAKMSLGQMGNKKWLGRKHTESTKAKISASNKGSKSYLWKGGITPKNKRLRHTPKYKAWAKAVYIRDGYTCQRCFKKGGKIRAHHMKHWKPNKKLRYDVDNGVTICNLCHEGFLHTKKARVLDPHEIGQTVLEI